MTSNNAVAFRPAAVAATQGRAIRLADNRQSLDPSVFDILVNHVATMSPKALADAVNATFPGDVFGALVMLSWAQTLRNRQNPRANPQSVPLNFVGLAGVGKSAIVYKAGGAISDWLTKTAADLKLDAGTINFRIVTRTLSGCNDITELLGVVSVNDGVTRVNPHADLPTSGATEFGIVFIDDFNRGDDRAISGFMEFTNTLNYNGVILGEGLSLIGASNPPGQGFKSRALDAAQVTRFINIPVMTTKESYLNDLVDQGVDVTGIGLVSSIYPEVMTFKKGESVNSSLSNERVVNHRNMSLFISMLPTLMHLPTLLNVVSGAVLGANVDVGAVIERLLKTPPLEAEDVIGHARATKAEALKTAEAAMNWMVAQKSSDFELRMLTIVRLARYVAENPLTQAQQNALCTVLFSLTKQGSKNFDPELFALTLRPLNRVAVNGDTAKKTAALAVLGFVAKWSPEGHAGEKNPLLQAFKKSATFKADELDVAALAEAA